MMKKTGIKTVAYIGYNDAWGDLVYDALTQAAEPAGIKIVANERYARTDTSVTPQILKIMTLHPDAVLTGGSGSPGALPHIALAERGYRGAELQHARDHQFGVRAHRRRQRQRRDRADRPGGGRRAASRQQPDQEGQRDFSARNTKRRTVRRSTDAFAAYAYDAMLILADAAKRALATGAKPGTPEFRTALRDALYSTHELVGTHAVYNFKPGDRYGTDERSRVLVELEKGEWKLIN